MHEYVWCDLFLHSHHIMKKFSSVQRTHARRLGLKFTPWFEEVAHSDRSQRKYFERRTVIAIGRSADDLRRAYKKYSNCKYSRSMFNRNKFGSILNFIFLFLYHHSEPSSKICHVSKSQFARCYEASHFVLPRTISDRGGLCSQRFPSNFRKRCRIYFSTFSWKSHVFSLLWSSNFSNSFLNPFSRSWFEPESFQSFAP